MQMQKRKADPHSTSLRASSSGMTTRKARTSNDKDKYGGFFAPLRMTTSVTEIMTTCNGDALGEDEVEDDEDGEDGYG